MNKMSEDNMRELLKEVKKTNLLLEKLINQEDVCNSNKKESTELIKSLEQEEKKYISKKEVLTYISKNVKKLDDVSFEPATPKEGGGFFINDQPVMLKRSRDYNYKRLERIEGVEYSGWSTIASYDKESDDKKGYEQFGYKFIFFCILLSKR